METLHIRSAGAARSLIDGITPELASRGVRLAAEFAAVGATFDAVRADLLAGARCDLVVLTPALVARLDAEFPGRVVRAGSLGVAVTWLACRGDASVFDISTPDALRQALLGIDVLFTGDLDRSTVGRHVVHVLERLGLAEGDGVPGRPEVIGFPGGAQAVEAMLACDRRALACAQSTEVRQHPAATCIGPLPGEFHLTTEYVVAVVDASEAAREVAASLTGAAHARTRADRGFDPA